MKRKIGAFAKLQYGASLPAADRRPGAVPVFGSNGVVGFHQEALCAGPGVVIGRKGSIGVVHYVDGPFWPIDTTYFVDRSADCDLRWFALVLRSLNLASMNKATGVPGLDRNDVEDLEVGYPERAKQISTAEQVERQLTASDGAALAIADQLAAADVLGRAFLRAEFGRLPPVRLPTSCCDADAASWTPRPLRELARLESGHTPSRRHPEWWGGDVPWLALPDIRKLHGGVAFETTEYTNDLGLANSSARLLPAGTVCMSRTASIGFVTMLGRPMATSQDFCNWICDPQKLDPEFLMYAFMASFDALREMGSGAVHKTIYMPTIEAFHLCAPPLPEQQRIAQRLRGQLAAARALRDRLAERQQEIERLPQRILAAAFGDAV